jgi:hypothetical protein
MAYKQRPFPTVLGTLNHSLAVKNINNKKSNNMAFTGERKINKSPLKIAPAMAPLVMGGIQAGLGAIGYFAGKEERDAESTAAAAEFKATKQAYEDIEYQNPYAGTKNWYADLQNTMEDATVNQQQSQFMREQQLGTGATTMEGLRAAAGGSGVGNLAMAMSRMQAGQAQAASAGIGTQEAALNKARLAQAAKLQQLEAGGAAAMENRMVQGEVWRQGKEEARTRELFAMGMQRDMAAKDAQAQARGMLYGGIGAGLESLTTGYGPGGDFDIFAQNPTV